RRLSTMLTSLLEQSDMKIRDIDGIILSAGPGSFTGLRIGYSLAKGLAHAMELPIMEVPTLDIWAYQLGQTDLPVVSIMDAHRHEIYAAAYRWENHQLKTRKDYQIFPLKDLPDFLEGRTLITGSEIEKLRPAIDNICGDQAVFARSGFRQPEGWALLEMGYQKFTAKELSDPQNCEPLYIRAFKGVM
ncbi:MAG: tRNA (adenosine(37)-N6)-threonylcarbamoyltransferase complex dimerization subunit type 1 TsaB, partial [Calditrichaeota bacterium]|nr:tRNA (adenosine(37)-N6)-threonylcarbamoyltransferase complex dimerization subunit type 1 TsaB [Calditrichota bacterium]